MSWWESGVRSWTCARKSKGNRHSEQVDSAAERVFITLGDSANTSGEQIKIFVIYCRHVIVKKG
jgi:hypothetical protein